MEWLISANHKKYDYDQAFKDLEYIDWKQNASYSVGDIVYIYGSRPASSIKYKVEVLKINMIGETIRDDKNYWIDQKQYESGLKKGLFARFKLIESYQEGLITLEGLHKHGLNGNIQGPRKLVDENGVLLPWAKYIHDMTKDTWDIFEKEAFGNIEYSKIFKKCKTKGRNYYDIYWDNESRVHLLVRNKNEEKYISIYVHKDKQIDELLKYNITDLNVGIKDKINIYSCAEKKDLSHEQLRILFKGTDEEFNSWVIETAIILKKNIEQILSNGDVQIRNINRNFEHSMIVHMADLSRDSLVNFKYTNELKLKTEPMIKKGVLLYKRDKQIVINALNKANFKCEIDMSHYCFIRKDGITPYTEAHHLVPMLLQDKFEYSLDIEENIVSLCSNCHNEIHYGANRKELVRTLYFQRIELLRGKHIDISLEELLEYYG